MDALNGLITLIVWISIAAAALRTIRRAMTANEKNQSRRQPQGSSASRVPHAYRVERSGQLTQRTTARRADNMTTALKTPTPTPRFEAAEPAIMPQLASGSMEYDSPEGECFTHPEHDRVLSSQPRRVALPGLTLPLDQRSLVQSVVFAEVLGKPVSMRRRRALVH
ncbi:MAG: hypothetical protein LBK46_05585 [Oscillospiraceae bacterium]|nr:hypothetical protein [Oscillospiraceae bacterium]